MAPRRAIFLSYGSDADCLETKKYIEELGVLLIIRDLSKDPLSVDYLTDMIGYLNINHFLNQGSESYSKLGIDKNKHTREEIIGMMAEDHTLIRRPIIRSARLITIGCDKKKIAQMLQMGTEQLPANENFNARHQGGRSSHRRRESSSASK
ncbi:MAG: hypothetical protein P1R58_00355 [bacterium]|nr:hypothetical protein [bacterium]